MSGNDRKTTNDDGRYVLQDEITGGTAGYIDREGNTRATNPEVEERVRNAFDHELLVHDGDVVDELGICFDGVCSIGPGDPAHDALVLRNLGALTGLRPGAQLDPADDPSEPAE